MSTHQPVPTNEQNVEEGVASNGVQTNQVVVSTHGCSEFLSSVYSKIANFYVEPSDNTEFYKINVCNIFGTLVVFIIVICTVTLSFTYVNYDEYALEKDVYGSVHLHPTYTQGRYFRPLTQKFVKFPSTYQSVDFTSTVFANNGMEFILDLRFYYRIPPENVGKIYNTYSKNYEQSVENNGINAIKNIAPYYSANDYLTNRLEIETTIAQNISVELYNIIGVIVPKEYVRITNIAFPDILIDTSLDSALALQQNELNQINQTAQLILSQTNQIVAQINANTQLLLQNTNNSVNQIVQTSQNEANNIVNTARSYGISYLFDKLDVVYEDEKITLVNSMAKYDNSNSTVFNEVFVNTLQISV